MKTKIIISVLALVFLSAITNSTDVSEAIVTELSLSRTNGAFVLINTDKDPEKIGCATNNSWDYTLPLETSFDDKQYAALLTAYASKRKVLLKGIGSCNEFSSIESVDMVRLIE